ncbi:hypothetical protein GURKE_01300 [Brevundimonas phage vB_BpoS-Gurke]|uniref:Uncharacterized protein n=1 Tax=Brevundimonas phage vB_BpoS-Gurke TaxID=2948599 RepID=A0A9E7SRX6_9CAUD|nr:hypothetical protein GURKE_01300 [Brevundimonas phage vB_BpoS-Gurke]
MHGMPWLVLLLMILSWPKHLRQNCPNPPSDQCSRGDCVHMTLFSCARCGGGEGSLTTDCPGVKIPYEDDQAVYNDQLDYVRGAGWVRPGDLHWKRA